MIFQRPPLYLTAGLLFCLPFPAQAQIFEWSAHNVQLLRGHDYELGSEERTILTLEHAHGHAYGDTFMFLDWTWPDEGKPDYYGEISPRFSLGKIFDTDLSTGFVKDVLMSTTLEKPKGAGPRYLYGGGVDLNVPGFAFFNANAYIRDDTQLDGNTWQMTLAWNRPFELGGLNLMIEGFADFSGKEDTSHPNQLIVPRLLLDISDLAGQDEGQLWVGMEYSYWHNKFGVDGVTESVPQLQVKWAF